MGFIDGLESGCKKNNKLGWPPRIRSEQPKLGSYQQVKWRSFMWEDKILKINEEGWSVSNMMQLSCKIKVKEISGQFDY